MLPPRELNPNYHGHWRRKQKATQELRQAAKLCALQACRFNPPEYIKAEVSVTLIVPNRRYFRDPDNTLASLKPAIDGCVDAGVIIGDSDEYLRYRLPIMYRVDKEKAPAVVLEFQEVS